MTSFIENHDTRKALYSTGVRRAVIGQQEGALLGNGQLGSVAVGVATSMSPKLESET